MSRWISWVLKAGHTELGMAVSDGWVKLAELAGAAQHCLRGHEQLDGAQLIETPHKSRIDTLEVEKAAFKAKLEARDARSICSTSS